MLPQVWVLEAAKLPILSSDPTTEDTHRILLGSPWEILQSSVGSGGILSLLSSHGIIDECIQSGIEYIEVSTFLIKYPTCWCLRCLIKVEFAAYSFKLGQW